LTPKQEKLKTRYNAIRELDDQINDKNCLEINKTAKKALNSCLENHPDWSERSFLQKLTDVLSFPFKPLYRAFFSKERMFENELSQSIEGPKLGR
jgi:hypothetical protein